MSDLEKVRRQKGRLEKAVLELTVNVLTLREELLLLNIHHSALTELLLEGRAITPEALDKRRQQILTVMQAQAEKIEATASDE